MPAGAANLSHLEAEVIAWPFWADTAFASRLIEIRQDPVHWWQPSKPIETLEEYLRQRARGLSLEALRQIRQAAWFGSFDTPQANSGAIEGTRSLVELLTQTATAMLRLDGDAVRLTCSATHPEAVQAERWFWLSRALPPGLLIAALAAAHNLEPRTDDVTLAPPSLERLLHETEVAEPHLHLSAALPFHWLWTHTMAQLGIAPPAESDLKRGAPVPWGSPRRYLTALATAALARLHLAAHLVAEHDDFTATYTRSRWARDKANADALAALVGHRFDPISPSSTLAAYRRMSGLNAALRPINAVDELWTRDPLGRWLGRARTGVSPETRFVARALRYLRRMPRDRRFAELFWQYVRVRVRIYRHLTEDPSTAGLDWFLRHFERIKPLRAGMSEHLQMAAATDHQRQGLRLAAIELRVSPESEWWKNRRSVLALAHTARRSPLRGPLEAGLIFHFQKMLCREQHVATRGVIEKRKVPHADPRVPLYGCRYGAYFHGRRHEAWALIRLLRSHPEVLQWLRGLDQCGTELAIPTWVLLPLLQEVRQAANQLPGPGLRVTLHAGEEYRHLAEGLRRIHEPIEFGLLQPGDRLGHALALGVDVRALGNTAVPMPAEERLDDFLWELERYRSGEITAPGSRIEWVRTEIEHLGEGIYQGQPRVEDLLVARRLRHRKPVLEWLGYPYLHLRPPVRTLAAPESLLYRYLGDSGVYLRGQRPLVVRLNEGEIAALERLQQYVRQEAGRLGLVVEANPSSNWVIGELDLLAHPAFRLMPLPASAAGEPVPVTVGDDDPTVFSTRLADELAHLYFGLIRCHVSSVDALGWIKQAVHNGWLARFTLPAGSVSETARGHI